MEVVFADLSPEQEALAVKDTEKKAATSAKEGDHVRVAVAPHSLGLLPHSAPSAPAQSSGPACAGLPHQLNLVQAVDGIHVSHVVLLAAAVVAGAATVLTVAWACPHSINSSANS